eukprot:366490-Chlamydomonas_euryale.AAC.21
MDAQTRLDYASSKRLHHASSRHIRTGCEELCFSCPTMVAGQCSIAPGHVALRQGAVVVSIHW